MSDLQVVSHESNGRILSGIGADVTVEDLKDTMARLKPPPAKESPATTPAAEPPASTATPQQSKSDKPTRGQARFDQLTGEREAERRRAEAAEKERDELRQRLDAVSRPSQQPPPAAPAGAPAEQPKVAAPAPTRAKPTEDQIGTSYKTHAEFVEDLADWKAEQRLAAVDFDAKIRERIEADRASRSLMERASQVIERGRKVYADFDAVRASGPGATVNMAADRLQAIVDHPQSEHVQYAIMKDAALAQKVASCHPFEFGTLLNSLAPSSAVASPASTAHGVTVVPPPPYQPVGSGSKTTVIPLTDLPKKAGHDFDNSGYRERRAAERARNRR